VINRSTLVTDADVRRWTAACARQIAEHVAPAYGITPRRVQFLTARSHAPAGAWVIAVLDNADQAGALGWHTEDAAGRSMVACSRAVHGLRRARQRRPCRTRSSKPRWTRTLTSGGTPGVATASPTRRAIRSRATVTRSTVWRVSDFVTPAWYDPRLLGRRHWLDNGCGRRCVRSRPGGYVVRRWPDGSEDQEFGATANRAYINAKRHQLGRAARRLTKETTR
jgi:hypothetical protein